MYKERKNQQDEMILMTMEQMVPEDHLLRKIETSVDLSFINEKTRSLYSQDKGRNCIEPVVLFKIVMLQCLYGIKSMRATIKQCETDAPFVGIWVSLLVDRSHTIPPFHRIICDDMPIHLFSKKSSPLF